MSEKFETDRRPQITAEDQGGEPRSRMTHLVSTPSERLAQKINSSKTDSTEKREHESSASVEVVEVNDRYPFDPHASAGVASVRSTDAEKSYTVLSSALKENEAVDETERLTATDIVDNIPTQSMYTSGIKASLPTAYAVDEDIPQAVNISTGEQSLKPEDTLGNEGDRGSGFRIGSAVALAIIAFILITVGATRGFSPPPPYSSPKGDGKYEPRTCEIKSPPLAKVPEPCPTGNLTFTYTFPPEDERYCDATCCWVRVGPLIEGSVEDEFGFAISLAESGNRFSVGAMDEASCHGMGVGTVRVYDVEQSLAFFQAGQVIAGIEPEDGILGTLSGDGQRLAVGAPHNKGPCNIDDVGSVRVYEQSKTNGNWTLTGAPIFGTREYGRFGSALALSSSGDMVAAGAPRTNNSVGSVKVFQYKNSSNMTGWEQMGDEILASNGVKKDRFGDSIALAHDGQILAVGQKSDNGSRGRIAIFRFSEDTWVQLGDDIVGEAEGDKFGKQVALSADGMTVVGAAKDHANFAGTGHVRVFTFNRKKQLWKQMGTNIVSGIFNRTDPERKEFKASMVAMSGEGSRIRVVVGTRQAAHRKTGYIDRPGYAAVYDWKGKYGWQQVGGKITMDRQSSAFSGSLSMSASGLQLLIGRSENGTGAVSLYKLKPIQMYVHHNTSVGN